MKSLKRLLLIAVSACVILTAAPVYAESATPAAKSSTPVTRIEDVMKLLQQYLLWNVTEDELVKAAIQGMIDYVDDPYTQYFTASEAQEFMNYINATDFELGFYMKAVDSRIKITDVDKGSPAEKAGIQTGDFVVALNGIPVSVDNLVKVLYEQLPKGDKGTLKVEVRRGVSNYTYTLDLTKVEYPQVRTGLFADKIGYLQLSSFGDRSVEEFDKGLADLRAKGMKSLIFDLRGNGGGDVEVAENIAKRFIKEGIFIFITDNTGEVYKDELEGGTPIGVPVYLLVDEDTASASEMLAGMLQDYGIAKVIGANTYGKGVIQQLHEFESDGAMLKLTTYEYFTPKGNVINDEGIAPDIEADDVFNQVLTAVREAGASKFTVQLTQTAYTVNGVEFQGSVPVIREKGKVYALARVVAPLLGAKNEWKGGKEQTLNLIHDGKTVKFPLASGKALQRNGLTYLDLSEVAKQFPSFIWKDASGTLTLTSAD
ncbi:S41 family peptidase [Gorillibacterium sp. CAU 1737]|uniref:S41 family peptidase n=1 Tax=Gorillibacterium sp. CAU 1737 TaxID=3140362 RepID=UPI0032601B8B